MSLFRRVVTKGLDHWERVKRDQYREEFLLIREHFLCWSQGTAEIVEQKLMGIAEYASMLRLCSLSLTLAHPHTAFCPMAMLSALLTDQ